MTEVSDQEQQRRWFWWRIAVRYGSGAIILVFFLTVVSHFRYTPDDTYVYLQYGRNIAEGEGFAFNKGAPGEGVPGPLWALLIAGGSKLDLDPYIVAKTLDVVFACFAVLTCLAFAFMVIRDQVYALIAAWICSFDAWVLRWSGTGIEASAGLLLTMLALWYAYRKEYVPASLLAGLLSLVRFEWGLLILVILADVVLNGKNRRTTIKVFVASTIVYTVVVGSWMVFSYALMGHAFPVTRHLGGGEGVLTSIVDVLKILGATQAITGMALVAGIVVTVKRIGWNPLREDAVPMLWILILPLILLLSGSGIGSRSLLPIVPIVSVYAVWGLRKLEIVSFQSIQRGLLVLVLVAIGALIQNQFVYQRWIVPHMTNVEIGINDCLKPIAYWLKANTPPTTTVMSPEVGVIGYVSGRSVYDAEEAIDRSVRQAFSGITYDEAMLNRNYEHALDPVYVVDRAPAPERLASPGVRPLLTRTFSGRGIRNPEMVYYTLYEVKR